MTWNYRIIETPTTNTGTSDTFYLDKPYPGRTVQIYGSSLGDVEADLQIETPIGWNDVYDDNGQVVLTATRPQEVVYGPGTFRLNFTVRTESVGACMTDYFGNAPS